MSATGPSEEAVRHLLDVLSGKCRAQVVSTAAALGIADRLAAGPRGAAGLAADLGVDADALERILRMLTGLGFLDEASDGSFALTENGAALRRDALGPLAEFVGAREQWDPWSRLRDALRIEGAVAYDLAHGEGLYRHLANDEEAARRYDEAVDAFTRQEARALCRHHDFASDRVVVDVGGGRGTLLLELLERWPHLNGVLLDLPHVAGRARAHLARDRIEVIGGSFLDSIPPGGDVYVLKHVLHNWDDDRARALLARCAAAMAPNGRVLVIEGILLPGNRPDMTRLLDLEMLVLTGGRERRKPELRRLFRDAGLVFEGATPLTEASYLIEGRRPLER